MASAAAVGLLTEFGLSRESYLRGGRARQRMWLTATTKGIALQPMIRCPTFSPDSSAAGATVCPGMSRPNFSSCGTAIDGSTEVLLFRLACARPPTARSLRRPLDQVLEFA
ncbi:hypothetical protein ACQP1G_39090 [Nocardia sp. CA-107356]|uniref:hypothetical protein n=1 Tax=Nocardia sp. CA-107356 TaxID=3239972 RepID=UPI003D8E8519